VPYLYSIFGAFKRTPAGQEDRSHGRHSPPGLSPQGMPS
jgi:hypothetical protein